MAQSAKSPAKASLTGVFLALGGGTGDDLPIPGDGKRPPLPDTKNSGVVLAAAPAAQETKAIDWAEDASPHGWSVTLSAVFDRTGVDAAWRDLKAQLGGDADGLIAFPQQIGRVVVHQQNLEGARQRTPLEPAP